MLNISELQDIIYISALDNSLSQSILMFSYYGASFFAYIYYRKEDDFFLYSLMNIFYHYTQTCFMESLRDKRKEEIFCCYKHLVQGQRLDQYGEWITSLVSRICTFIKPRGGNL